VETVAPTDATVLITEPGTGKELIARAIHEFGPAAVRSPRQAQRAAIPDGLRKASLFGHEKARSQDHAQRIGRFEVPMAATFFWTK